MVNIPNFRGGSGDEKTYEGKDPWWVDFLNVSLERNALATLVGFVLVDLGSALVLWRLIVRSGFEVDPAFTVAYALVKGPLKLPRMALDASAAAVLTKAHPPLAHVRVDRLVDAATGIAAAGAAAIARLASLLGLRAGRQGDPSSDGGASDGTGQGMLRGKSGKENRGAEAQAKARELLGRYGLAFMASKNVIGPACILILYAVLKAGGEAGAWLTRRTGAATVTGDVAELASTGSALGFTATDAAVAAGGASQAAGSLALASMISTLLFPLVVLGAAVVGPLIATAYDGMAGVLSQKVHLGGSTVRLKTK